MAAQLLQPSDILQRRLDILGIAPNVPLDSGHTGQVSLIFNTGNIAFPTGANRVFVAHVIVDFSAGAPPSGVVAQLGIAGGLDWIAAGGLSLDAASMGFSPPYVLSPTCLAQPNYNPPVYAKNLAFTVRIVSSAFPVTTLGTFTAVGWAE